MLDNLGKKIIYLFGSVVAILLGSLSSLLNINASKDESLFISTANADIQATWGWGSGGPVDSCSGGCCAGCFPKGTHVSLPLLGYKEIQDVIVGDTVFGFNPETLKIDQYKVLKTMEHSWDEVHTRSPLIIINHEKGILKVTKNHPLYRKGFYSEEAKDFCEAGSFSVGDILTLENGVTSKILSIEDGPEYDFVYNFEVENAHTYIAGGVLVHNSCFPVGVFISTPFGNKEIQNIVTGDIVYGFDADNGDLKESKVSKIMKHSWDNIHTNMNAPLIIINHEKGTLKVTKTHSIYRKGFYYEGVKDFCQAGSFSVGDILTLENGVTSKILSIEDGPEYDFVYNFEVEGVHTYIAGGVRVHV